MPLDAYSVDANSPCSRSGRDATQLNAERNQQSPRLPCTTSPGLAASTNMQGARPSAKGGTYSAGRSHCTVFAGMCPAKLKEQTDQFSVANHQNPCRQGASAKKDVRMCVTGQSTHRCSYCRMCAPATHSRLCRPSPLVLTVRGFSINEER
jgi:hypothetical protein